MNPGQLYAHERLLWGLIICLQLFVGLGTLWMVGVSTDERRGESISGVVSDLQKADGTTTDSERSPAQIVAPAIGTILGQEDRLNWLTRLVRLQAALLIFAAVMELVFLAMMRMTRARTLGDS
jgi:hypothetical protein